MSNLDTETLAESLAAKGREELIGRFREAYATALGMHADLVSFDSERIESMVQHSATEADGLQWRRALAGVAARELDIDLGSALTHPAVVRAHQLAGAPSYESALAALAVPAPPAVPPAPPTALTPLAPVAVPVRADPVAEVPKVPEDVDVPEPAEVPEDVELAPLAHDEAEPDAVEAEELAEAELAVIMPEAAPESLPEPEVTVAQPADEPEPEPTIAEPEDEPEPEATVAEPEDEPEPAVGAPADAEELASFDQPTMAYDTLEPEAGPADEDVEAAAEPTGDVLSHRAADFAEEFMAGEPAAAVQRPPVEDDITFEPEAVDREDADVTEFGAVHLGGVASLPSSEEIAVRLSEEGLDLLQDDGTIVGRLGWTDIAALEVTVPHGRRRRRNAPRLVVHTSGGSARFEVPNLSGDELQDRVQPLMARFGQ